MTPATWHFREFKPGDNVSDPDFARALFTRDDSAIARSLVREAVQNSLDARQSYTAPVKVRFALRTGHRAATSSATSAFFEGLWPHITSPDCGVEEPPDRREAISYLAVEDFGTRGLTGDPSAWDPFEAARNSFFLFFRALGRSGKEGEDRGRWGVGKFVFPMTSRGHCLLALTISETHRAPLVMGRSVLKTHRAGRLSYHPDGHWGARSDSELVLPVGDDRTVGELTRAFSLKRSRETGLSVVVPWIHEGVTAQAITTAAAGEYFLPILRGDLRIEVDDNGNVELVDETRLSAIAASIESPLVRARVELGLEAATWPDRELMEVRKPGEASDFDWEAARLTDEQRALASGKLEAGAVVGFRVRTSVRPKASAALPSHFDVFLRQVRGLGRARPLIVREGIAVSEDRTSYLQDCIALIIVDDAPLATFVGDAETPAHNELQSDLVRTKYTLAGKLINFLRGAPSALIREVEGADRTADLSLLAEFFPKAEPAPIPRKPKPREAGGGDDVPEVPDIPTRPARFRIGKAGSGFTVTGTGAMRPGARVTIMCAYDIRRGNPLRKYRELDFIIGEDVAYTVNGLLVESAKANTIVAEVEDPSFHASVDGFDRNRNIFVRVTVEEPGVDA